MNSAQTRADDMLALASGPAVTPKVVSSNVGRSMVREIHVPLEGQTWAATICGLTLPVGPSTSERVNLLDPIALFDPPSTSRSPAPLIIGESGTGHAMLSKETR